MLFVVTLTHVEEKLLVDHDGAGAVLGGGLLGPPVVRNQLQPEQGAESSCELCIKYSTKGCLLSR